MIILSSVGDKLLRADESFTNTIFLVPKLVVEVPLDAKIILSAPKVDLAD